MRRFRDDEGRTWDAVVGRESWGAFYAILVPDGGGEVRQAALTGMSSAEAERELEEMGRGDLLALLAGSRPKDAAG